MATCKICQQDKPETSEFWFYRWEKRLKGSHYRRTPVCLECRIAKRRKQCERDRQAKHTKIDRGNERQCSRCNKWLKLNATNFRHHGDGVYSHTCKPCLIQKQLADNRSRADKPTCHGGVSQTVGQSDAFALLTDAQIRMMQKLIKANAPDLHLTANAFVRKNMNYPTQE